MAPISDVVTERCRRASFTVRAQTREASIKTTTESVNTLVLHHEVGGDQRRDLASGAGGVHLAPSGGAVVLDHLGLVSKTSSQNVKGESAWRAQSTLTHRPQTDRHIHTHTHACTHAHFCK